MHRHIAAVDLGSHSFHMVVARVGEERRLTVVDRIKEPVRLAAGLDPERQLSAEAQNRALHALARMSERLEAMDAEKVRAVGTETWRRARNRQELLPLASRLLGHPIQIISGAEEARLVWAGAATAFDLPGRRLVVDVGGASTELIAGQGQQPSRLASLHMGCVSWTQEWFADGPVTQARLEEAVNAARQELGPVMRGFREEGWDHALGTSGTARVVEGLIRDLGLADALTREGLEALGRHLCAGGPTPGLSQRRRDSLLGGLAVLLAVARSLKLERLTWVDGALKEGLLVRMTGGGPTQIRAAAVAHLAERLEVDQAQADRVEACALHLFDQAAEPWGLEPQLRPLLGWAARLHEAGQFVAWTGYHKHGAYLLSNADLPGFSRQEQGLLAAAVLSHRRRLSRRRVRETAPGSGEEAVRLAILLRLAATLHRTRKANQPRVDLRVEDRVIHLSFPQGWLDSRPLSQADLEALSRALVQIGYRLGRS